VYTYGCEQRWTRVTGAVAHRHRTQIGISKQPCNIKEHEIRFGIERLKDDVVECRFAALDVERAGASITSKQVRAASAAQVEDAYARHRRHRVAHNGEFT